MSPTEQTRATLVSVMRRVGRFILCLPKQNALQGPGLLTGLTGTEADWLSNPEYGSPLKHKHKFAQASPVFIFLHTVALMKIMVISEL